MVEAIRVGTIVASNQRAFNRWKLAKARAEAHVEGTTGLTGAALEQAVLALAVRAPEYVVVERR